MATPIPLIGQQEQEQPTQEPQQQQFKIDADVKPEMTVFRMQTGPFDVRLQPVPNDLMAQVVAKWLLQHPQDALLIMADVKKEIKQNADMIRTIRATKN